MIPFSSSDPFPLMPLDSYSYKEAQEHAALADEWLGFQCSAVEEQIRALNPEPVLGQQNWQHLPVQAMQTPYIELRNILDLLDLQPGQHIVDLGAAYSRMGFVLSRHHPAVHFDGFELESLRVAETRRIFEDLKISKHIQCHQADLAAEDFLLPTADVYFIFDYGSENNVRKTLLDLQKMAKQKDFRVVARGRLSRALIHQEHLWLSEVNEPQHFHHFSIYKS